MLVMKLAKNLNYKFVVKLIILMEEVGGDIGTVDVISFSKCIKYGVGVIAGGNLC